MLAQPVLQVEPAVDGLPRQGRLGGGRVAHRGFGCGPEVPSEALQREQAYPRAVPIDIRTAAVQQEFDGQMQATHEILGQVPYLFRDTLTPGRTPYLFPRRVSMAKATNW